MAIEGATGAANRVGGMADGRNWAGLPEVTESDQECIPCIYRSGCVSVDRCASSAALQADRVRRVGVGVAMSDVLLEKWDVRFKPAE